MMELTVQTVDRLQGSLLEEVKVFLLCNGLSFEDSPDYTCLIRDFDERIIGTGSLSGNVLKYIAVEKNHQGEGLLGQIITILVKHAFVCGQTHLFIFTKPQNKSIFSSFGFFPIEETMDVLLMENKKGGINEYVRDIVKETSELIANKKLEDTKEIGAIVVNCNPFTNGHRYLIEQASKRCSLLHVFVVSSDKSVFPTAVRLALVKEGTSDLANVIVHQTRDYLVSPATFPSYFLKEKHLALQVNCQLDIALFLDYIVPALGITCRFVGTEPFCKTTEAYNRQMRTMLQAKGIDFVELKRKEHEDVPISASRVRNLMALGRFGEIEALVPRSTYEFILSSQGQAIVAQMEMEKV